MPERALLIASSGGHLAELHRLAPRLELPAHVTWVTFDTAQSRLLLAGERVVHVPFSGPRQGMRALVNAAHGVGIVSSTEPDIVVSTGAAIAISFVPFAQLRGIPCHYIESAARSEGPSLTGKLLQRLPAVKLYTQHKSWAGPRWTYGGSVFDEFVGQEVGVPDSLKRVVVTLGTMPFGFRRLVDRLLQILPAGVEVTWQTGSTPVDDLPVQGHVVLSPDALRHAMQEADVVIAHAGVGSALDALDLGLCPVLLPRLLEHREHVDDHQVLIARALEDRGLAVVRDAGRLEFADLLAAAGRRVAALPHATPMVLV